MSDKALKEIYDLRARIDEIDRGIVERLNDRAKLSLDIREIKEENSIQLYDPGREEAIFQNVTTQNDGPLYDDDLRGVFEAILRAMKSLD
ncbi:MAG TPA: chorismate mutase [Candidatus Aquicultor sp.]|jgi:chorismate mutase/prephenate dehydratase